MKPIKFKKSCSYKGENYEAGEELRSYTKNDIADIRKMNEKGFIEPLTQKELKAIANGSFFISKAKEEE